MSDEEDPDTALDTEQKHDTEAIQEEQEVRLFIVLISGH